MPVAVIKSVQHKVHLVTFRNVLILFLSFYPFILIVHILQNLCYDLLLFVKCRKIYIMVCTVKNFRFVTGCFPWNSTRNFPLCKKNGIFSYIGCHFKIKGFRIRKYWFKYLSSIVIAMFCVTTQLFYARQNTLGKKRRLQRRNFPQKWKHSGNTTASLIRKLMEFFVYSVECGVRWKRYEMKRGRIMCLN